MSPPSTIPLQHGTCYRWSRRGRGGCTALNGDEYFIIYYDIYIFYTHSQTIILVPSINVIKYQPRDGKSKKWGEGRKNEGE